MNTVLKANIMQNTMQIEKAEKHELEQFLLKDIIWSSEVIFTLEDNDENIARWFIARDGNILRTAMMICPTYRPVPIFLAGNVLGAPKLFEKVAFNKNIFIECPLDFTGIVKERYFFPTLRVMVRMVLKRDVPLSLPNEKPRRLNQDDLKKAFELYERVIGNTKGFDAMQFIRGTYYGVELDGNLISIAGTQTISPKYETATIGNVLTDANYRGKGFAMACVYLLTRELKKTFKCITINVNRGNKTGIHIYRRCGFVKKLEYFEGQGTRKEV
ncbi:MAG: GNAT family N-acetyltransferase [Candidatus Aureabacteria bacterium]|nr:GNAT family N-acetyltransferase [Candidatus Auribacterota bacterium]